MTRFPKTVGSAAGILVLALISSGALHAGDFESQFTGGSNFFSSSPPCPVRQFPTFESLVPVPAIVDPFAQDLIPMFCDVQVSREGKGVKKAKGKFEADLIVIDLDTGISQSFPIASGDFKTNKDGLSSFDFDLPSELFADGFESGDVSAWSYTRTDFSNKKKSDSTSVSCVTGASRSD